MATLRGLLYGLGRMGRHHKTRLLERGGVALTCVDPALGLGAPALRWADWDFAVVATPAETHLAVARPLLELGIPTLIEKPLAPTAAEARALGDLPHAMVGHIERFNPALVPVAGLRPRFVQAERLSPWPARGVDVDVVADLMVHDLDLARQFLGGAVHDVRAIGVGVLSGRVDICNARVGLGDGVATISASRVSREAVRKLRLVEDGVYWSLDLVHKTAQRVRWGEGDLSGEAVPVPEGDALRREHDALIALATGEAPSAVPLADGVAVLELAEAVREAMARGG